MRIISGKYRGKKLKEFQLETTKPTTDRVKESIFNLIQFNVDDAVVLDLFSGTGSLGIEAISRGANKTFLVDKNPNAIKIIKDNLKGIEGDVFVENTDFVEFLNNTKVKFDLVFLDPPYATNFGKEAIDLLIQNRLLNDGGVVIFETSADKNLDIDYKQFSIKKKKYGNILIYKMVKINE